MRYKGKNEIDFSCDKIKNVTVILGDNTVGKTTIAQAFRWCLYGAIIAEKGKKQTDYEFLNKDVFSLLDSNSKAGVSVKIVAEDDNRHYEIFREIIYSRYKNEARESSKKVEMKVSDINNETALVDINPNKIDDLINELFPKNLSHYFLFDGERWGDTSINGVKENIKDSVHILTGLSAYSSAMYHIYDMGANSVIKKFKSNIQGGGAIYDNLQTERDKLEHTIEVAKKDIDNIDIEIKNIRNDCVKIDDFLERNQGKEALQNKIKDLQQIGRAQLEGYIANYKMLVNEISEKAYMVMAEPIINKCIKMVKSVAGERRDIPHMRQSSIDAIISNGRCICGNPILPNSSEYNCLMEQRNYLPPADIGSLLGEFEKTANRWRKIEFNCEEYARKTSECSQKAENNAIEIAITEKKFDENINFAEKRSDLRRLRNKEQELACERGEKKGRIESCERRIKAIEENMKMQLAKTQENEKWQKRVELAQGIYDKFKKSFKVKEAEVFNELNTNVQVNFERMFNAHDKKIELTPQYDIKMSYEINGGYREEKNLSEGEKVARNFAFIVTIMDYSRKKKIEKEQGLSSDVEDTLPIVLDGPFSKLGEENIGLIAEVLPTVSEQVILFMLDKDWKYTGLDKYVGASYVIDKDPSKAYASISKRGEE